MRPPKFLQWLLAALIPMCAYAQVLDVDGDNEVGPQEALAVANDWKGAAVGGIGNAQFVRNFTVAPGESVEAGDIVAFIDGTVRKGTGNLPALRPLSETSLPGISVETVAAAAISPNAFVVAWNADNIGRAQVGTVVGNTIVYGPFVNFGSGEVRDVAAVQLAANRFALAYQDSTNSQQGRIRFADVEGDTIQFEEIFIFNNAGTEDISLTALGSSRCIAAYKDRGASDAGNARIVGRDLLNQMSGGAEATFTTGGNITHTSIAIVSSSAKQISFGSTDAVVAVSKFDNAGPSASATFRRADLSGFPNLETIAFGTEIPFPVVAPGFVTLERLFGNRLVYSYVEFDLSGGFIPLTGYLGEIEVIGDTFNFGPPTVFSESPLFFMSLDTISRSEFLLGYSEVILEASQIVPAARSGRIVDGQIEIGPSIVSSATPFGIHTAVVSLSNGAMVLATVPGGAGGVGKCVLGSKGFVPRIVGIAKANASGGQTVPVIVPGISDAHTGLSAGEYYYVAEDGSLTTKATATPLGIAVSGSEIVLTGGVYAPSF